MRRIGFDNCCPRRFSWFRAKWSPKSDLRLENLPKPRSSEDVTDDVPFDEKIKQPNILIVRHIDACFEENGTNHRTSRYDLMRRDNFQHLVVRRGQNFKLKLHLSRPFEEENDGISFIFVVEDEEKPSHGNGTMVGVPLMKKPDRYLPWNVVLLASEENVITVHVLTPPDAIVARWRMDVDTRIIEDGAYSYSWETGIFLLFNPWSKQDQVYMKNDEWREEAVLNDIGIVYRGTYNRIKPVIWKYDQFERDVLECSIYLMHVVGKVKANQRSDPVQISRAFAAAINSSDDLGAVMGNWSTDHSGGTAPTKWLGSKEILQKYYQKKKPVKYGQCWVFSGVLTTVCRALGIPSRTITNYASAHDTQNSLTVDYFLDEKGSIMEELNSDSIWNFHVWTEVWMTRPDLGRDYSGWQAIDATPQEISGDMYRCGPASVTAVKEGEVLRPHDSAFLFSEVNADKIFWRWFGPTQPLKLLRKDIYAIGKLIITKSPGGFGYEDVTASYKYLEKTSEERSTMLRALRQSENLFSRYYLNEDFNDIYFHFNLLDDVKIGQPFDVALSMRNRSKSKVYQVQITLRVDAVTYTGKVGESVKNERFHVAVKPDSTHEVKLTVTYDEYRKRLVDQGAFSISCLASIENTKYEYFAQDDFRIRKPDIKITFKEPPVELQEVEAEVSVENPLPVELKRGEFTIEAPGVEGKLRVKLNTSVAPGERATGHFNFTPPRTGRFAVAAKFFSKEIDDVDGFTIIMVQPKKEQQNGR
ncbi:hypothetical protein ABEB36_006336 [Hypothenemus hampei]|uniref:protein-glutamine gamma-glutamyltransferase n=1 Tax=Hypothenemus hampei TaxID=57062 RepID=A0ABD1EQ78_HYPHA